MALLSCVVVERLYTLKSSLSLDMTVHETNERVSHISLDSPKGTRMGS